MPEPDEYVTEQDLEHELEDLISESTTRPLTHDEAQFVAFQCGVRFMAPYRSSHA